MRNVISLFLITLFAFSCHKAKPHQMPPVPVSAVAIQPQTIAADFEYIGVGESSHIVPLRARVTGYLQEIRYKEGGLVKEGDLMFVLDQRPFIANVNEAKGILERQKSMLWDADQIKARMEALYPENAVSLKELDNAIAEQGASTGSVQAAAANLDYAEINLGFASIAAPVTGLASQAKYREGALISTNQGDENLLTTIYVVDPIWVNFNIPDNDLLKFRKEVESKQLKLPEGMNFQIEAILTDGTVLPSEGTIDFINPAIQQNMATMLFRAILPNPDLLIRPGQFVRVVMKGAMRPNAVLVPQTAVVQGQKGTFVYVIANGKASMRPVKVGDWVQNNWIIQSGLNPGDVVIVQGVNKIRDGSPVVLQSLLPGKSS